MSSLILGTAGHIDHGKTALVKALTGIDTDRLAEEKERGITIDLGFAELPGADVRLGVVDVPGHEGFVRNMLAGATGMDVVLLVVAADEGVMPQTREHLAIVSLLNVQRLVVALTKTDLVEPPWLELVRDEVRETLAATAWADAPILATSAVSGEGIDGLRDALLRSASGADPHDPDDLTVLPVDRAFTVRGTGTVVTGTLWSGSLRAGDRVRLLPAGLEGRVRGLQVHGADVDAAAAGARTAVALGGDSMDLDHVARGQTLVTDPGWPVSRMLTVRFRLLPDTEWGLEHNQRLRVHLGTAEVMARCVLFGEPLAAGGEGWGQLRLEAPATARARQRLVIRSYSPVSTIGGAEVAEPEPPKRGHAGVAARAALGLVLDGSPDEAVAAAAELAGRAGVPRASLPRLTGLPPSVTGAAADALVAGGAVETSEGRLVGADDVATLRRAIIARVDDVHERAPFRPGVPVEVVRDLVPAGSAAGLGDALLAVLGRSGVVSVDQGIVARTGFAPRLSPEQEALETRIAALYDEAGLAPPTLEELPPEVRGDPAFWELMRRMEDAGRLTALEEGRFIATDTLTRAVADVRRTLGGRSGLGPADFKQALPVSRKNLLPLLAWLDRTGVTLRDGTERSVAEDDSDGNVPGASRV